MKSGVKSVISIIVSLFIVLSSGAAAFAGNTGQIIGDGNIIVFIDVPSNHWAKEQIDYFAQEGIVNGYGDGTFKPESGVTREEFCKFLVTTFKQPLEAPVAPAFSDVTPDRWSFSYIEACREFLTGYANPFGGLPAFHPAEYATREDIAVALVRMMGLTENDAANKNYATWKFKDGNSISPGLLPYVSIACEKGLISGYPDGTFGPQRGITRAETVALLNRATKQAVTDINKELDLAANIIYSPDGKTTTINIQAESGTTVKVNGETVKMSDNYYGKYEGSYVYKFEKEGSKEFVVTGTKGGKTKKIGLSAKYEIGVPILNIENCPANVTTKNVTISGTLYDRDYTATLTINGESVASSTYANSQQSWSQPYTLKEGTNTFEFVLTNSAGMTTTAKRVINFSVSDPELKITSCPANVTTKNITISGTMYDANYDTTLTINGEIIGLSPYIGYATSWSESYTLKEGANTFEFVLTNAAGKIVTDTKTIYFSVGGPELKITSCPMNVTNKSVTISGTTYDANYAATLTINGELVASNPYIGYSKSWSESYTLKEGANTFEFVLTNAAGKIVTDTKTIYFSVGGPELKITSCPMNATNKNITISGTTYDANYAATLNVNGELVASNPYIGYSKSWSWSYTLKEGANTFEFVLTNAAGKTTTETKIVYFSASNPELKITNCPARVTVKSITISGAMYDANYATTLMINGESVESNPYVGNPKSWSRSYILKEGENTFEFVLTNAAGKTTVETKTVTYTPETPSDG